MKNTRTSLNRFPKRRLYTLLLLALPALQAHANTYSWTGILDNNFNDAGNWQLTSTDTDPNGHDQMVLNTNGTTAYYTIADGNGIVVTPGGAYTPRSLSIGTGSGQQGALTATRLDDNLTSGHYAYLSFLNVGVEGGSGQLDLHHNDSIPYQPTIFQVSGGLNIGSGAGSEGVVNLLGQGKSIESQNMGMSTLSLESGSASIGTDGGKGTLTIDGAGFTANSSTNIILGSGSGGEGTMNILGGGKLTAGVMGVPSSYRPIVGDDGGTGYLNISGTSADGVASRAVIGNSLAVGQNGGLGEVSITQGGKLLTTTAYDDPASIQLGVNGGTGKVTIDGSNSIWEVAGYSYFTGGSLGQVGELHVGVSGSGELTVGNGGKLTIGQLEYGNDYDPVKNQSYYYETNFAGGSGTLYLADEAGSSGTINIGAPVGQAAQGTGILDILDIQFGAGNGTIVFNHTDTSGNYTFDTPLVSGSGYSLIRQVAGTTTLADQPGFTGDISVEGGTLLINGSQSIDNGYVSGGLFLINGNYTASNTGVTGGYLEVLGQVNSPVTISGSGTLSGNGIIAGDVTVGSGGTVSPGTSQGATLDTLTVDSITFNPGSLYWAQSNPDRTTDMIHASTANGGSGAITLNGGTVHVIAASNGWQENTQYDLLTADAGVTGHFDSITTNLAFLTPGLEYDPTHAYLYFTRNETGFGEIGGTYNEINTGWGIQGLNPGHPVYDSIVSMSAEEARASYDNLSGEIHASAKSALFTNSRYARAAVNQHLGSLNTKEQDPHKNLWVSVWGHEGHLKADGNAERLSNNGGGFLIGSDLYSNGTTTIGVAGGYEQTRLDIRGTRASDAEIDAFHVIGYGRTTIGAIDLKGGVGYSWLDIDTERNIWVDGLSGKNQASYNGGMVQIFAEGSHTFELSDSASVTPYAGLAYQHLKTDGFTESGGSSILHGSSSKDDRLSSTVGVRGQLTIHDKINLYADAGWQHNFGSDTADSDLNFIGGYSYNIRGVEMNRDSAIIAAGATFELQDNMHLSVGYEGEFGNRSRDNALKVLWRLNF